MAHKALAWPGRFRLMPLSLGRLRKNSLRLDGASVYLQPPIMADYPAWARLRRENQAYLQPREQAGRTNRTCTLIFVGAFAAMQRSARRARPCVFHPPPRR